MVMYIKACTWELRLCRGCRIVFVNTRSNKWFHDTACRNRYEQRLFRQRHVLTWVPRQASS